MARALQSPDSTVSSTTLDGDCDTFKGAVGFGECLYRHRVDRGLTQVDVSRRCGMTRGYYSQLENSKRPPPPRETVQRVARALRLANCETVGLYQAAARERGARLRLPSDVPPLVAGLVRALTKRGHSLSAAQLGRIKSLLEEDAMA